MAAAGVVGAPAGDGRMRDLAALSPTAVALIGICTIGYVVTMFDRVMIFRQGLASRAILVADEEAREIADSDLPIYTILVPAYDEPEVVGDLLGAMARLEYPPDKLRCCSCSRPTTRSPSRLPSPAVTPDRQVLLVPPAEPRTKPRPATTVCTSPQVRSSRSSTPRTFPNRSSCAGWWPRSSGYPRKWHACRPSCAITTGTRTC